VSAAPPNHWLRLLPSALIERRPGLALILARMAVFSMDMADFKARLEQIDVLLARPEAAGAPPPWPSFQADLTVLRGILAYWQGRPADTIRLMRAALAQGPTKALAVQALLQLGLSYVASGSYAEGAALLEGDLPEARALLGERYALYQHSCLANMHQLAGEIAAQAQAGRRLYDELAARPPADLWVGYAASSLGLAAYERNDLAVARVHFGALVGRKYRVSYPGYMTGLTGIALIAVAEGDLAEAEDYAARAVAFAQEVGGVFLTHQALGCVARVALARGDHDAALAAVAGVGRDIHLGFSLALETPRLTHVQALAAGGGEQRLAEAEGLLAGCLAEIAPLHHTRLLVRALATRALLRQAQGRDADAAADLEQAVALGGPRGFVRTFADLGPPIQPLLWCLPTRGLPVAYVERLLGTLSAGSAAERPAARPAPALLTRREAEILTLLAERWSDKEIAEQLVIAPNTVRKHTSTIYEKLGVGTRREAVDTARDLGLLPPA
jgi:LuxR family maltose regulon positive regulatory protein